MTTLQVNLLGKFELIFNGQPVTTLHQPRQQSLLAYLLLQRGTPHPRREIAFLFWPDTSERQAFANLRKALYRLRRALPQADQLLQIDSQTVCWQSDVPLSLDVADFQAELAAAEAARQAGHQRQAAHHWAAAAELYGGDLLPACYDDWLLADRERLRREYIRALTRLGDWQEMQRDYPAAIRASRRLLHHDPLHEAAHRRLMQRHLLNGEPAEALRVYHACTTLLQQELQVEPSPATQEIYERILARGEAPRDRAKTSKQQPARLPLVGRQGAWRKLLRAWKGAQRAPRGVIIAGEAGIGKSHLAEELLIWAGRQGFTTAHSRAYEGGGRLAYAPVAAWLRRDSLRLGWQGLAPAWLTELARLLPELLIERPELPPPQPLTQGWQRLHLFEALSRAILQADQPLLLVLDDLQWCDQETLEWLGYLLRFDPQARLLVVGTVRVEAIDHEHPLTALRGDLRRAGRLTEIELGPLAADETTTLAEQVVQQPLADQARERLYQETEGNPLFIVETVRAGGMTPGQTGEVAARPSLPARIQAVIDFRLGQLSARARTLVDVTAVIGQAFTVELLAGASRAELETVIDGLDEAWQRRIIREQDDATYDFSHDKIREVAYQQLSSARQRLLHQRVAEALEEVEASRLAEISGRLGEHYRQAGNEAKARGYFYQAGQRAAAQFANREAVTYLSRALALTPETEQVERYEILLALERVHYIHGPIADLQQDLEQLEKLAKLLDDGSQVATTRQAEVTLRQAQHAILVSNYSATVDVSRKAASLAKASGAVAIQAEAQRFWGLALSFLGKYQAAGVQLDQALILAQTAQLSQVEAATLSILAGLKIYSSSYDEAHEVCQQSLKLARAIGDRTRESLALFQLGQLIIEQGEGPYAQARAYFEESVRLNQEISDPYHERFALGGLGVLLEHQGHYSDALDCLNEALLISQKICEPRGEGLSLSYLANVLTRLGEYQTAQRYYQQALDIFRAINLHQEIGRTLSDLGFVLYLLGDFETAHQHNDQALRIAQEIGVERHQGYALTRLGQARFGLGRRDKAVEAYQQALTIQQTLGQHNRAMEAQAGLARLHLNQGDLAQAQAQVESILPRLEHVAWCGLAEPLRLYLTCYRTLQAAQDPRAVDILQTAHRLLQERAARLDDPAHQQSYLQNVAGHQEILAEYAELPASSSST